jgi:hypothetical protein
MLHYRLLMSFPATNASAALSHLERSWGTWLAHKRLIDKADAPAVARRPGLHRLAPGTVATHTAASDGSRRWRLLETRDDGLRTTSTLTYVDIPAPMRAAHVAGWVELTVESSTGRDQDDDNGLGDRLSPPRLATYLLRFDGWHDGPAPLGGVQTVTRNTAAQFVALLADPSRRLPALALSTPSDAFTLNDVAAAVHEKVKGHASVWVLDRQAVEIVLDRLGRDLGVWGGAVRTYLPRVRLEDPTEIGWNGRHRVLSWQRLRDQTDRYGDVIASSVRLADLDAQPWTVPPVGLEIISIPVAEVIDNAADTGVSVVPTAEGEVFTREQVDEMLAGLRARVAALNERLQTATLETSAALELAAAAEAGQAAAIASARETAEDNEATYALFEDAESRARSLQFALAAAARGEGSDTAEVPEDPGQEYPRPESFDDLLALFPDIPEVVFTGDEKKTRQLDRHENRRAWIAKTWDVVLAMVEYARAVQEGTYAGLFSQWCDGGAPPGARTLPAGRGRTVVPGEDDTVRNNAEFARERHLPVPVEVDETGFAYMWAHCRIGGGGNAPRLHYLEHDGKVYIGLLGWHPRNTKTN